MCERSHEHAEQKGGVVCALKTLWTTAIGILACPLRSLIRSAQQAASAAEVRELRAHLETLVGLRCDAQHVDMYTSQPSHRSTSKLPTTMMGRSTVHT